MNMSHSNTSIELFDMGTSKSCEVDLKLIGLQTKVENHSCLDKFHPNIATLTQDKDSCRIFFVKPHYLQFWAEVAKDKYSSKFRSNKGICQVGKCTNKIVSGGKFLEVQSSVEKDNL